jgi:hypothetical protein
LLKDCPHHEQMQWLHLEFERANGTLHTVAQTRYAHGDINVPADSASRDRLADLYDLSAQLGITQTRIEVPSVFHDVLRRFEEPFAPEAAPVARPLPAAPINAFAAASRPGSPNQPPYLNRRLFASRPCRRRLRCLFDLARRRHRRPCRRNREFFMENGVDLKKNTPKRRIRRGSVIISKT